MSEDEIKFVIEACVFDAPRRRFRWRLIVPGEPDLMCPSTFATRREAAHAGDAALKRVTERATGDLRVFARSLKRRDP